MKNVKTLVGGLCFLGLFGTFSTSVYAVVFYSPTVTTSAISDIAATTATGNGNITGLGNPNPTAYGVCWNTTGTPTISDSKANKGATNAAGAFTASMTGLTAGTTYHVRAFATNNCGTAYGGEVTFTTASMPIAVAPSGSGTEADPYKIANINHLYWISQDSGRWNKYYIQTASIDASGTDGLDNGAGALPIGNSGVPFAGSYNGQGYTISRLTISRLLANHIGLFGYLSGATVKNIGLVGCKVSGSPYVGALAGYSDSSTSISGCYVTGSVTATNSYGGGLVGYCDASTSVSDCYATTSVNGTGYVGGLLGRANSASVTNCYASGNVTGSGSYVGGLIGINSDTSVVNCYAAGNVVSSASYIGGLVGQNQSSGTFSNCQATGNVTCTGSGNRIGGLVGANADGTINSSYATGNVTGNSASYIGGFVGYDSSMISYCYATGTVTGSSYSGGFVGSNNSSSTIRNCYALGSVTCPSVTGGFIGMSEGTVEDSYATGLVTGTTDVGGLTGANYGTINTSLYDTSTTGKSDVGKGAPTSTANMKISATFTAAGWDFAGENTNGTDDVWTIDAAINNNYPCFDWQFVPDASTQAVSNVGTTTATGHGEILYLGVANPTAHGVCWNTAGSPTISDSYTDEGGASAIGTFNTSITGLTAGTTYYARAYVTNPSGTAYGQTVVFRTNCSVPTVTTAAVSSIESTKATGNGDITSLGGENPTAHGVCWNTTGTPTISDSKTDEGAASATGAFSTVMSGLSANTTYYVRAYATNAAGTSYGDEVSFTTEDIVYPEVRTTSAALVSATEFVAGGDVEDNGEDLTAVGLCWNTTGTPTINDSKTDEGTDEGDFASDVTGLTKGMTYYYRAYAINANGTIYGEEKTITMTDLPYAWAEVQPTGDTDQLWLCNAISSNGKIMLAGCMNGRLYLSKDSGATWTEVQPAGNGDHQWCDLAMSADGSVMIAITMDSSYVYLSKDSGITWTPVEPVSGVQGWHSEGISADGKVIYVSTDSKLGLSTDSGTTWSVLDCTQPTGNGWYCTDVSPDGKNLMAGDTYGRLYLSHDTGTHWAEIQPAGDTTAGWMSTTFSSDGTMILVGNQEGGLYLSKNSGSSWSSVLPAGDMAVWFGEAMSHNGSKMVLSGYFGCIYTSTNSGTTWTKMAPNKKCKGEWARISMSVDGSKILVGEIDGRLYVGTSTTSSTAITDGNGGAVVANNVINAAVSGFDQNLPVSINENGSGDQVLTIGETSSPRFSATISGASAGTTITASTNDGNAQDTIEIAQSSGRKIKVILVQFPDGSNVGLDLGDEEILSSVTNASGQAMNVSIEAVDNGGDITFIVTYHAPASNNNAKIVWTAPGGSVTIEASGIPAGGVYNISLSYAGLSLSDVDNADLRMLRVASDGTLSLSGTSDLGNVTATTTLGDYGVTTSANKVWANVDTLGTFAVGVPEEKQVTEVVTTTTSYMCPTMGVLACLFMIMNFIGLTVVRSKNNV